MTLAEKVGQMTQAERANVDADPTQITTDNLGSVLSGGGSVPTPNTPTAWADMVDRYQAAALNTRLGIPLIYGIDTVHGDGNMQGATVFPHNIGLGATATGARREVTSPRRRRARAGRSGRSPPASAWRVTTVGSQLRVVRRVAGARGEDGDRDRRLPGQAGQLSDNDRVLATAKHFAGDGLDVRHRLEQEDGQLPDRPGCRPGRPRDVRRLALAPYVPRSAALVGSVMPSYSDVVDRGRPGQPDQHARQPRPDPGWLRTSRASTVS
jgi:beta-glucosidase